MARFRRGNFMRTRLFSVCSMSYVGPVLRLLSCGGKMTTPALSFLGGNLVERVSAYLLEAPIVSRVFLVLMGDLPIPSHSV